MAYSNKVIDHYENPRNVGSFDKDDPTIATDVAIFPSPLGKPQNISNLTGRLREVFDDLGFDWVSSHTFRRTVATRLDEAGMSARQVADHLGHQKPSMTLDTYMGRKVANSDAAAILGHATPPKAA